MHLQLDAFVDRCLPGEALGPAALAWARSGARSIVAGPKHLLPADAADDGDWHDSRVGWGIIALDGVKLPAVLERLRKARGDAPLFRYVPKSEYPLRLLEDERGCELDLNSSPFGCGKRELPRFLLIYGSPTAVPWDLQYVLNAGRCVGRIDLDGTGLENYVNALIDGFGGANAQQALRSLLWATDHGENDISHLMRTEIADRLHAKLAADNDLAPQYLSGPAATVDNLLQTLIAHQPGLVVTTSHGLVWPPESAAAVDSLGAPVDTDGSSLDTTQLLREWSPAGAIWYAHACCSAGSDSRDFYAGLFTPGSANDLLLKSVAAQPARIAPLPRQLLGHARPLRAFIGHVQPTFNWTLRQPGNGQATTHQLIRALYDRLYLEDPVGLAFQGWYQRLGPLYATQAAELVRSDRAGPKNLELLVQLALTARDVQSTVILGDPTAVLPIHRKNRK